MIMRILALTFLAILVSLSSACFTVSQIEYVEATETLFIGGDKISRFGFVHECKKSDETGKWNCVPVEYR